MLYSSKVKKIMSLAVVVAIVLGLLLPLTS